MRIALLGDIALFGINTVKEDGWKKRFQHVKGYLSGCDYVIGNLETPLTVATKVVGGKSAYIKGNGADIEILKYLGVTHVSLANNHMYDFCEEGLLDTIKCLESNGIEWYGVNGKKNELKKDDEIIELLGYCCYSTDAVGLEYPQNSINVLDPRIIVSDLINCRNNGAFPILSIHWGQEHVHYPNYDHIEISRMLAKQFDIVIHGHHPHVIQGIEKFKNSLIAYSLGNFCFDDVYTSKSKLPLIKQTTDNKETVIIIIEIANNVIVNTEIVPLSFENGEYQIKESIKGKIEKWTSYLRTPKDEYISHRSAIISKYINGRKAQRDLNWYIKRLNIESVKMLLEYRRNAKRYDEIIKKYIHEKGST